MSYRWGIFWANLDPVVGSEQSGRRPVLVVSAEEVNQALPIITVLPLTSARPERRVYSTETLLPRAASGLTRDSIVMAHQTKTIAKERLAEKSSQVDDEDLRIRITLNMRRHLRI